eukprot:415768-Prymnesium_polylepis.1
MPVSHRPPSAISTRHCLPDTRAPSSRDASVAIMGDTYDRVCEARLERGLLNRAGYLVEQT